MTTLEKLRLRELYVRHWDAVRAYEAGQGKFDLIRATARAIKNFKAECIVRREMSAINVS